jgi:hypothetical protein
MCIDLVGCRPKNFQRVSTIEIYYNIGTDDSFYITYNFHKLDFHLWLQLVAIHEESATDVSCIYEMHSIDYAMRHSEEFRNLSTYYTIYLVSKEINLYRNISLIPFLEHDDGSDNMIEMINLNTYPSESNDPDNF